MKLMTYEYTLSGGDIFDITARFSKEKVENINWWHNWYLVLRKMMKVSKTDLLPVNKFELDESSKRYSIKFNRVENSRGPFVSFMFGFLDLSTGYFYLDAVKTSSYFPLYDIYGTIDKAMGLNVPKDKVIDAILRGKVGEDFFKTFTVLESGVRLESVTKMILDEKGVIMNKGEKPAIEKLLSSISDLGEACSMAGGSHSYMLRKSEAELNFRSGVTVNQYLMEICKDKPYLYELFISFMRSVPRINKITDKMPIHTGLPRASETQRYSREYITDISALTASKNFLFSSEYEDLPEEGFASMRDKLNVYNMLDIIEETRSTDESDFEEFYYEEAQSDKLRIAEKLGMDLVIKDELKEVFKDSPEMKKVVVDAIEKKETEVSPVDIEKVPVSIEEFTKFTENVIGDFVYVRRVLKKMGAIIGGYDNGEVD